jgi:hypothetical protein
MISCNSSHDLDVSAIDAFVNELGLKLIAKKKQAQIDEKLKARGGDEEQIKAAKAEYAQQQEKAVKVEAKAALNAAKIIVGKQDDNNPNGGRSSDKHRAASLVKGAAAMGIDIAEVGTPAGGLKEIVPIKKPKKSPVKWLPGDRSETGVLLGPLLANDMALPPPSFKSHADFAEGEFASFDKGSKEFDILGKAKYKKGKVKTARAQDFLDKLALEYARDPMAAQRARSNFFEKHPETQFNAQLVVSEEISKMTDSEGEETTETQRDAAKAQKVLQNKLDDEKLAAMKIEDAEKSRKAVEVGVEMAELKNPEGLPTTIPEHPPSSGAPVNAPGVDQEPDVHDADPKGGEYAVPNVQPAKN